jgi:aspartate 1-decarboxylase
MKVSVLKSKIHRVKVTESNLDYPGSIGIDEELMKASGIIKHEKVLIANLENGNRWETYVIPMPKGSGKIAAQGGSAKMCSPGDTVIIMSFTETEHDKPVKARVITVKENGKIEVLEP